MNRSVWERGEETDYWESGRGGGECRGEIGTGEGITGAFTRFEFGKNSEMRRAVMWKFECGEGTRVAGGMIESVKREGLGKFGESGGRSWWIGGVMASTSGDGVVSRWRSTVGVMREKPIWGRWGKASRRFSAGRWGSEISGVAVADGGRENSGGRRL